MYAGARLHPTATGSPEAKSRERTLHTVKVIDEDAQLLASVSLATRPNHVPNRKPVPFSELFSTDPGHHGDGEIFFKMHFY